MGKLREFWLQLRLSKPWNYKVPALMAIPYALLYTGVTDNSVAYLSIACSFATIIGFAGFGYLTNDLADREADTQAGKTNFAKLRSEPQNLLLLVGFLALALLPWLWFPTDMISWILIAAELLCFLAYAFPPFRLKGRPGLDILTDAAYAHVIPALLAAHTFSLLGDGIVELSEYLLYGLVLWQLLWGLRNILKHQLEDLPNDQAAGINTFTTRFGVNMAKGLFRVFVYAEYVVTILTAMVLGAEIQYLFIAMLAYYAIASLGHVSLQILAPREQAQLADNFYNHWLPIFLLVLMIDHPLEISPILLVHLVLLPNGPGRLLKRAWAQVGHRWRWLENWLFGSSSYLIGLGRHLLVFCGYSLLVLIIYGQLDRYVEGGEWLNFQRILSRIWLGVMIGHLVVVIGRKWEETKSLLWRFFFANGSAYNLALIRLYVMWNFSSDLMNQAPDFSVWTSLPPEARQALPLTSWWIDLIPINPDLYHNIVTLTYIAGFMAAIGLLTRGSLLVYVVLGLYAWGVPNLFGKLNHNHVSIWIPAILAFSRCGDVLSIDSRLRQLFKRPRTQPHTAHYALPMGLIWTVLVLIYVFSGLHKLWDTGLGWALSESAINQMHHEWFEHFGRVPEIRIDRYPILAYAGSFSVILFELLMPLLVLHPILRSFTFFGIQGFHRATSYLLYIDFYSLRIASVALIDWHKMANWMSKRFGRKIPRAENVGTVRNFSYRPLRPLMLVGGMIIGFNSILSLFAINSWPFSAYPTYSAWIESSTPVVHLSGTDASGNSISFRKAAREANFSWENIRPFELKIARLHAAGETQQVEQKIREYWWIWKESVPAVQQAETIQVMLQIQPLDPDRQAEPIEQVLLGTYTQEELNSSINPPSHE